MRARNSGNDATDFRCYRRTKKEDVWRDDDDDDEDAERGLFTFSEVRSEVFFCGRVWPYKRMRCNESEV